MRGPAAGGGGGTMDEAGAAAGEVRAVLNALGGTMVRAGRVRVAVVGGLGRFWKRAFAGNGWVVAVAVGWGHGRFLGATSFCAALACFFAR